MGSGVLSEGKSHLRLSGAPVCVSMHVRMCVTTRAQYPVCVTTRSLYCMGLQVFRKEAHAGMQQPQEERCVPVQIYTCLCPLLVRVTKQRRPKP